MITLVLEFIQRMQNVTFLFVCLILYDAATLAGHMQNFYLCKRLYWL